MILELALSLSLRGQCLYQRPKIKPHNTITNTTSSLSSTTADPTMPALTYESVVPQMRALISRADHRLDMRGRVVTAERLQQRLQYYGREIPIDPEWEDSPRAVQQYRIEYYTWKTFYWMNDVGAFRCPFPGIDPMQRYNQQMIHAVPYDPPANIDAAGPTAAMNVLNLGRGQQQSQPHQRQSSQPNQGLEWRNNGRGSLGTSRYRIPQRRGNPARVDSWRSGVVAPHEEILQMQLGMLRF